MKLSVGPKKGVWNHKTQFEICKAFEMPLKSLLGQIYYWTSSWRLKRILLGPISYKAATTGPLLARAAVPCSTQPYACVDQEGQSRTRLNVLHADAAPRHRPSGDQLAWRSWYYYSQSASILPLSGYFKVLLSTLLTYPWSRYVGAPIYV